MQHPNNGQVATPRLRPSPTNPASKGAGGAPASANGSQIPPTSATGIDFPLVGSRPEAEHQPFSIAALGKRLAALRHEANLLDVLTVKLGREVQDSPLDARRLAQRHAEAAHLAVEEHCEALEGLILRSRAETPADAVTQIMVVSAQLECIRNGTADDERDQSQRIAYAGLQSALRALATSLSIPLADLGGVYHASTWCDRWPNVITTDVQSNAKVDHREAAIDGSVRA